MTQIADKVYRNAKVYSIALDGKETHTEAVAIKDGKFVYVGDEAGIAVWIGDTTERASSPDLSTRTCTLHTLRNYTAHAVSAVLYRIPRLTRPKVW